LIWGYTVGDGQSGIAGKPWSSVTMLEVNDDDNAEVLNSTNM